MPHVLRGDIPSGHLCLRQVSACLVMGNVFLAVDYGPEHLESPSLGGRPLRISPSWHWAVGKRGRGVGVSGPAGATVSRWPFRRDFKTALAPGREAFGIFFAPSPTPMCTLSTEKGRVLVQGTPLRTGHSRLRPAVTHYYSEIVTSGAG